MKTSQLTPKILAYRVLEDFDPNDIVDWAIEMIELGHEGMELSNLACMKKSIHFFEGIKSLEKAA